MLDTLSIQTKTLAVLIQHLINSVERKHIYKQFFRTVSLPFIPLTQIAVSFADTSTGIHYVAALHFCLPYRVCLAC